jgi:4-carboxymuconolactone decarboxylase
MDEERFALGEALRRQVLGDQYVDANIGARDELDRDFWELVTEFLWGGVWSRPGIELGTRSMLNIAMLTVMGRREELSLHIKGALNNGCSRDQIRETILHVAVYAGMPAAVDGFRTAKATFAELDAMPAPTDERDVR